MKTRQEHNLTKAYVLGGTGLIAYWYTLVLANLRLGHAFAGEISRVESLSIAITLPVSLAVIVGSAAFIVYKLWRGTAEKPEQVAIRYFALAGFIIAVAMIFKYVSLLGVVAAVSGVEALRHSYKKDVEGIQDIQNYRIISFVAIAIVLINMTLPLVVGALN